MQCTHFSFKADNKETIGTSTGEIFLPSTVNFD